VLAIDCSKFAVEPLTSIRLHHIEAQATACVFFSGFGTYSKSPLPAFLVIYCFAVLVAARLVFEALTSRFQICWSFEGKKI
jgi:hypothetical protein